MDLTPSKEGDIPFTIPSIPDKKAFTHYKVFGDLENSGSATPLIALHGGPGSGHEYLLPFANLWERFGVPVVLYDQIGCASSTPLREYKHDAQVFSVDRFLAELENVIEFLGLNKTGFSILGHSWGGMLASEFAVRSKLKSGLKRLVLANSIATAQDYTKSVREKYEQFPQELQDAVAEAIRTDKYDSPGYRQAGEMFLKRHFYRLPDFPPEEFKPRIKYQTEDPTSFNTMYGKVPTICDGTLKDWSIESRLHEITVPTFVYNAEFDGADDEGNRPFFEKIPKVRWYTFPGGAHMCHLEGELREKVLVAVGEFLTAKASTSS